MPNPIVFPYGITLKKDGEISAVPVAEVAFLNKEGEWLSLFLIIDSGATISALPKSDAAVFGIEAEKGKLMIISGIGGEKLRGWHHQIRGRLGGKLIHFPVIFLDKDAVPRVLGRTGIFEKFILVFDEKLKISGFFDNSCKQVKIIRNFLNDAK